MNTEPVKKLLNIPAERMFLTILPFGYPTETFGQGIKTRKPLAEIAHQEKFGQAFRLANQNQF